jgi:hypothetical protein
LPYESSSNYSTPGCPYLTNSGLLLLDVFIRRHLECSRIPGSQSANPYQIYRDYREGFHVTFFEIITKTEEMKSQSQWKLDGCSLMCSKGRVRASTNTSAAARSQYV